MHAKGQAQGRVDGPVVAAPPPPLPQAPADNPTDLLKQIMQLLKAQTIDQRTIINLTSMLGREATSQAVDGLLVPTRDSKAFVYPVTEALSPAVSASSFTTILSKKVPEGYVGIITQIGLGCNPTPGFADLQFQLCNSDEADPYFAPSGVFTASTMSTPFNFFKVVPSQRNIELRVKNSNAGVLQVSAIVLGFYRPLKATSRV
jgi:hypothetical protein